MPMRHVRRTLIVLAAVLVSVFVVLTYAGYRRDIERAYERISTGSEIAETRCGRSACA
jgi:hypothetical protein